MIKSILKWALGIIGAAAIAFTIVHTVKMNTDENYRTHINAAWGIEQTVEDEETDSDQTTEDETDVPIDGGDSSTTTPDDGLMNETTEE